VADIVGKPWWFCHTLRHDGIYYGDYIDGVLCFLWTSLPVFNIDKFNQFWGHHLTVDKN
jgi:hypothetical protein